MSGQAQDCQTVAIQFRLDADDCILDLQGLDGLRIDGHDPEAMVETLLGGNLLDHVSGPFARLFLKAFLTHVRRSGEQARRRYRSDTTFDRIWMEMRGRGGPNGMVFLEHEILKAEPLPFPVEIAVATHAGQVTHARCCLCNRLRRRGERSWLEPETALVQASRVLVIQTVCQSCRETIVDLPSPSDPAHSRSSAT